MKKNIAHIQLKAPYYKIGDINHQTKKIWFIFHGYGQLAHEFSSLFSELISDDSCLIFPQGLSKFYLKGVDKKIGSSWMTAHDRELDIDNYLSYLNHIFEMEIKPHMGNATLHILGFSQGGLTASRWIYESRINYDRLILWGSSLAHEIDQKIINTSFSQGENILVLGDKDRFINQEQLEKIKAKYDNFGFTYSLLEYHGGHDIYPEILKKLI